MKDRICILFLSALLLMTVSYVQVFHHMIKFNQFLTEFPSDLNDEAEEGSDATGEKSRETDQDEDPFRLNEMISISLSSRLQNSNNGYHSLDHSGHHPEIISPPPQAC